MILNNILTREQESTGLFVFDDEDMVYLSYGTKVLAVWSSGGATPDIIQSETQNILDKFGQRSPIVSEFEE
jgi:hypothetical protein